MCSLTRGMCPENDDSICHRQVEVGGDITSLDLSSLISQTEYDVAVTPIYNTGPGNPMLGTAITGLNLLLMFVSCSASNIF